jgi:hypothetical protein
MKQIILLLSIVFLYSNFATAQKTISKEDFESLVDYANCKYTMAFIEKNDVGKDYFNDTYIKKVKPELEKAKLDNFETIINYQKLVELLSNNAPASELVKKINDRKLRFDEFQNNESLINSLGTTGLGNIDLSKIAANIQNEIFMKYNSNANKEAIKVSENEVVKTQTIQTSSQVEKLQSKFDQLQQQNDKLSNDTAMTEYQKSLNIFKLVVLSAFVLLVVLLVVIFFLLKKYLQEYIIKQVEESRRIEAKIAPSEVKPYSINENDINTIIDRILKLQKEEEENKNQPKTGKNETFKVSKPAIKYLKGKSGKIFNRAESTPDNSFFKLLNENDEAAQFEFFGNEAEALAKRIFSEDISIIISGSYQNARSIITSKPGKIKRVGEQWEVTEPIQIKLI